MELDKSPVRHRKIYRRLNRLLSLALALMIVISCCAVHTLADEPAGSEVSFYKMSSVASAYLNNQLSSGGGDLPSGLTSGDAGALLGYSDEADQSDIITKWFMSALSSSSASFDYTAIAKIYGERDANPLYAYCKYGQLLRMIGFDSTATESSFNFGRTIGGGALLVGYYLANFVPKLFSGLTYVLKVLNPFRFVNPNRYLRNRSALSAYATPEGLARGANPFSEVASFLTRVYNAIYENLMPAIVLLLTIALITRLLFSNLGPTKSSKNWARIKNYFLRLTMMILGVPLIGMLYTDCLNLLSDDMGSAAVPANRIVMSTLLDFESWARELQLAIPSDASVDLMLNNKRSSVYGSTYSNLRESCYNINCASFNSMGTGGSFTYTSLGGGGTGGDSVAGAVASWNETSQTTTDTTTSYGSEVVADMIRRYMDGTFYYAGSFESYIKSDWDYEGMKSTIESSTGTVDKFKTDIATTSFDSDPIFGGKDKLTTSSAVTAESVFLNFKSSDGLSIMAMYNYLTSKFDATNVVVYSSEKASSGLVRESHRSVNLIGGNMILAFLYWLNACLMLIGMFVLGAFYAFSMVFGAIRRLFFSIPAMFGTVAGSIQMGAKLLTMATCSILEIVGTMVIYSLASELLLSIDDIIMLPMTVLNGSGTIETATGEVVATLPRITAALSYLPKVTVGVVCVMLIVSCIVYILFLMTAMRVRKAMVTYLDRTAGAFIDSLFGVKGDQTPDSPGLGSRAMGALGAGAGAGIASKFASKGDEGGGRDAAGEASPSEEGSGGGGDGDGDGNGDGDKREGKAGDEVEKSEGEGETPDKGAGFEENETEEEADKKLAASLGNDLGSNRDNTGLENKDPNKPGSEPPKPPEGTEAEAASETEDDEEKPATPAVPGEVEEESPESTEEPSSEDAKDPAVDTDNQNRTDDPNKKDVPTDPNKLDKDKANAGPNSEQKDATKPLEEGDRQQPERDAQDRPPETPEQKAEREKQEAAEAERKAQEEEKKAQEAKKLAEGERQKGPRSNNAKLDNPNGNGPLNPNGKKTLDPNGGGPNPAGPEGESVKPVVPGENGGTNSGTNGSTNGTPNTAMPPVSGGPVPEEKSEAPAPKLDENGNPIVSEPEDDSGDYLTGEEEKPVVPNGDNNNNLNGPAPAPASPVPPADKKSLENGGPNGNNSSTTPVNDPAGPPPAPAPAGHERTARGGGLDQTTPRVEQDSNSPPGVELPENADISSGSGIDAQTRGLETSTPPSETVEESPTPEPEPALVSAGGNNGSTNGNQQTQETATTPSPAPAPEPEPGVRPAAPSGPPTSAPDNRSTNGSTNNSGGGKQQISSPAQPASQQPTPPAPPAEEKREARPSDVGRVEGTINGRKAEGTVRRNADGSISGEMHTTEKGPSLTASRSEAGIVSTEISGSGVNKGAPPTGGRQKRQLSDSAKIAGMAAAAAFMQGSKNEFISSMGSSMQYGLTSELTDRILNRDTPLPKYGAGAAAQAARARKAKEEAEAAKRRKAAAERRSEEAQREQQEADDQAAALARQNQEAAEQRRKAQEERRKQQKERSANNQGRKKNGRRAQPVKYDPNKGTNKPEGNNGDNDPPPARK